MTRTAQVQTGLRLVQSLVCASVVTMAFVAGCSVCRHASLKVDKAVLQWDVVSTNVAGAAQTALRVRISGASLAYSVDRISDGVIQEGVLSGSVESGSSVEVLRVVVGHEKRAREGEHGNELVVAPFGTRWFWSPRAFCGSPKYAFGVAYDTVLFAAVGEAGERMGSVLSADQTTLRAPEELRALSNGSPVTCWGFRFATTWRGRDIGGRGRNNKPGEARGSPQESRRRAMNGGDGGSDDE